MWYMSSSRLTIHFFSNDASSSSNSIVRSASGLGSDGGTAEGGKGGGREGGREDGRTGGRARVGEEKKGARKRKTLSMDAAQKGRDARDRGRGGGGFEMLSRQRCPKMDEGLEMDIFMGISQEER